MSSSLADLVGPTPKWALDMRADLVGKAVAHPLYERIASGDRNAIAGILKGFWSFVVKFPRAIFAGFTQHFRETRAALTEVEWRTVTTEMKRMRDEEMDHTKAWRMLANSLDVHLPDLGFALPDPSVESTFVKGLLRYAANDHAYKFFLSLYATEVAASVFAAAGLEAAKSVQLDTSWFNIHVHGKEPGHEELDLFLASKLLATTGNAASTIVPAVIHEPVHFFKWIAEESIPA